MGTWAGDPKHPLIKEIARRSPGEDQILKKNKREGGRGSVSRPAGRMRGYLQNGVRTEDRQVGGSAKHMLETKRRTLWGPGTSSEGGGKCKKVSRQREREIKNGPGVKIVWPRVTPRRKRRRTVEPWGKQGRGGSQKSWHAVMLNTISAQREWAQNSDLGRKL